MRSRREALGEQRSTASRMREEAALVVERAAAPDEAVGDHALEGRVLPLLGARLDRHHVLVGEQQQRGQRGLATPPGVEQARAADELARERRVHARELRRDRRGRPCEGRGIVLAPVLVRDGREAQAPASRRADGVLVDRGGIRRAAAAGRREPRRSGARPHHRERARAGASASLRRARASGGAPARAPRAGGEVDAPRARRRRPRARAARAARRPSPASPRGSPARGRSPRAARARALLPASAGSA